MSKNKTVIKCYNQDELFDVCLHLGIVPKYGLFQLESDVIGVRIPDNKVAKWFMIWNKGFGLVNATKFLKQQSCLH